MRCASCGLPLAPTRTHCPGCGTTTKGEPGRYDEQPSNPLEVPQQAFPSQMGVNGFPGMQVNIEVPQQQWTPQSPVTPWENQNAQGMPFMQQAFPVLQPTGNEMPLPTQFPTLAIQSSSQAGQPRLPGPGEEAQSEQAMAWKPVSQPRVGNAAPIPVNSGAFPQPPRKTAQATNSQTARFGFTIAGLCVLTGGLILIFVYIISLSLPLPFVANQPGTITSITATTQGFSPVAKGTATNTTTNQTTPVVTPTVGLPGQPYIDSAQMASIVNTYTAQPTQLANNFKVKQQIFVTFMLHPKISGGAVCLLWYLNQQEFSHYAFAVNATPQLAYSYAYAGSPGAGSVEIYWASTTDCTDKALAQVVNFTVNP